MNINEILKTNYVQDLIRQTCGDKTELVVRQDSYAVRSLVESDRNIHRIIILPPKGFTANEINQMNSHDEAEYATIQIKGAVKESKHAFSKLKDCLLVASIPENGAVSNLSEPYLTFKIEGDTNSDLEITRHSSGIAPFNVVKSDGYGFYHNLVNVTDEWLVLRLHKVLRPQRNVNLSFCLQGMQDEQASIINELYASIVRYGDNIFGKTPKLVTAIMNMPRQDSLPALGEMLYVHDSGMHEACTAFALILKISKQNSKQVLEYLKQAIEAESIPLYYGHQLIAKIENSAFSKNTKYKVA